MESSKFPKEDFKGFITNISAVNFAKDGTYDAVTGIAKYTTKEWYSWVHKVTELHKSNSKSIVHYFTVLFSVLLLFMSISAFWMFKPGTKLFSGGVRMTIAGIIGAVLLLLAHG